MDLNTIRRIADFRRSLLNYEQITQQTGTSDPDSGYRTATPEPAAFIADPDSPHLPNNSSPLHPNITTRPHKRDRTHRRFSALFSLSSHRGRHTTTPPPFAARPKISRPLVNQGEIDVPHNGPYIYNHPSRPRLDVEIPRSSFSDLWGQRYGPVGEDGYDVDMRNTQSLDFGRLYGNGESHHSETRRETMRYGDVGRWYAQGEPEFDLHAGTDRSTAGSGREDGDADVEGVDSSSWGSYTIAPPSESSASLPSISNIPLPQSPAPVFEEEEAEDAPAPAAEAAIVLEEETLEEPEPLAHELSERWIRHPLRQNPPSFSYAPPAPPPSSPVTRPSSAQQTHHPSSASVQEITITGFHPSCGVLIEGSAREAFVRPFVFVEHEGNDFESASGSDTVVVDGDTANGDQGQDGVAEQTLEHAVDGQDVATGTPLSVPISTSDTTPPPSISQSQSSAVPKQKGALRSGKGTVGARLHSLCCGLFTRSRSFAPTAPSTPVPRTHAASAPVPVTSAPSTPEPLEHPQWRPQNRCRHGPGPRIAYTTTPPTTPSEDNQGQDGRNQPNAAKNKHPQNIAEETETAATHDGQDAEELIPQQEHTIAITDARTRDPRNDVYRERESSEHNTTAFVETGLLDDSSEGGGRGRQNRDEILTRRQSLRHSWVTVSRWLE